MGFNWGQVGHGIGAPPTNAATLPFAKTKTLVQSLIYFSNFSQTCQYFKELFIFISPLYFKQEIDLQFGSKVLCSSQKIKFKNYFGVIFVWVVICLGTHMRTRRRRQG